MPSGALPLRALAGTAHAEKLTHKEDACELETKLSESFKPCHSVSLVPRKAIADLVLTSCLHHSSSLEVGLECAEWHGCCAKGSS